MWTVRGAVVSSWDNSFVLSFACSFWTFALFLSCSFLLSFFRSLFLRSFVVSFVCSLLRSFLRLFDFKFVQGSFVRSFVLLSFHSSSHFLAPSFVCLTYSFVLSLIRSFFSFNHFFNQSIILFFQSFCFSFVRLPFPIRSLTFFISSIESTTDWFLLPSVKPLILYLAGYLHIDDFFSNEH